MAEVTLSDETTVEWRKVRRQARYNVVRRGKDQGWTAEQINEHLLQLGLENA